ncbi:MAG: acyclic terpene utilization AtuA family protein [Segniliparus sp.]|uniref:acyclic terpene utilization AtuA family protein n=1 Tax=Segniliparus sp. TaxID=2804064 RepID=UPI003F3D3B32
MSGGIVRIGNASGFYGDRFAAVREMLTGGELDVLTGDYLAELTMLILGRDRLKDPGLGYAKTFLRQMEEGLGLALERGVKVVVNAGGLNPKGLADKLGELAGRLGLDAKIAHVRGDDLVGRSGELGFGSPAAANAYLGAFGIVEGLAAGADVVVTGRITDASLVVGPAAWRFGWARTDYDRLAGAVVAGHLVECGTQVTGGNYAFFKEIADLGHAGFPIAEIAADGTSVITKHAGTGGAVTVGTVTAQLLYEIQGARYAGPDVTTRLDTVQLAKDGPDRVRVSGTKGEPPPEKLKVSLNTIGGFRNEMTFILTGLDIEEKAELARSQLEPLLAKRPAEVVWDLARVDRPDAPTQQQASALLQCVVRDFDPDKVGRQFSSAAVELALASYPGFSLTTPPGAGSPYGVFTAGFVPQSEVPHEAVLPDGSVVPVPPAPQAQELAEVPEPAVPAHAATGATRRRALGAIAGARSGDKGGSANIGVWARTPEQFSWLVGELTVEKLKELLPEAAGLVVRRHVLPNLRAINFVIEEILGRGVAEQARFDPQAKGLGEWLRSRELAIPESLLGPEELL